MKQLLAILLSALAALALGTVLGYFMVELIAPVGRLMRGG